jgi:hypothetical protein
MQTTKTQGGCGCGGGCGCKAAPLPPSSAAVCAPCDSVAFVRPRFFAGQLLTEDDLGALVDYVIGKQRFHNARLMGDGVVCGLEVQCGPCDDSKLVVQPGYALDCCGNDLVLSCERTLDVAQMVRDLKAKLDGTGDCADPCGDPKTERPSAPRTYCLYARYAERSDQPVSAYPVGDDCDASRCEPTRVLEGISFELRCPKEHAYPTFSDSRDACVKLFQTKATYKRALAGLRFASQAARTEAEVEAELSAFDPEHFEAAIAERPADERLVARQQALLTLAPLLKRSPNELKKTEAAALVRYAKKAAEEIEKTEAVDAPTRLDRMLAIKLAQQWTAPEPQSAGAIRDPELLANVRENARLTVQELKSIAGCSSRGFGDCTLREQIDRLEPRTPTSEDGQVEAAWARKLGELTQKLLDECVCAAANPPCPPCDDTGVLLACFEVDRCKVVKICSSDRKYVLAPSTLRYWGHSTPVPATCCQPEPEKPPPPPPPPPPKEPGKVPDAEAGLTTIVGIKRLASARNGTTLYERLGLEAAPKADAEAVALRAELSDLKHRLAKLEKASK